MCPQHKRPGPPPACKAGDRFGRLVVVEDSGDRASGGNIIWRCQCDCGSEHLASGATLRSGQVRSCGCFGSEVSRERARDLFTVHGHAAEETHSPTYTTYRAMLRRVHDPEHRNSWTEITSRATVGGSTHARRRGTSAHLEDGRMSKRAEKRHHIKRLADKRRPLQPADFPKSDNELASRHPHDCGRRCLLCHYDKLVLGGQRRARAKAELTRDLQAL